MRSRANPKYANQCFSRSVFIPTTQFDNVNSCLSVLRAHSVCGLDSITTSDICAGRLKAVLALFFALSRFKQASKQKSIPTSGSGAIGGSAGGASSDSSAYGTVSAPSGQQQHQQQQHHQLHQLQHQQLVQQQQLIYHQVVQLPPTASTVLGAPGSLLANGDVQGTGTEMTNR